LTALKIQEISSKTSERGTLKMSLYLTECLSSKTNSLLVSIKSWDGKTTASKSNM
jgi:hypothetical protein